ncbi:MAG: hypothetical protein N3F03_00425 [Ignavibacteria bacterium]|nr:hypothetical protein [Ignavibacteria bacterium]
MRIKTVLFCFLLITFHLQAQGLRDLKNNNQFTGGLGLSWINGEPYYLFNLSPDLSFGKFGIGLDVNFRIDRNGNLRNEDFNTFSDYLSLIKYVRYGQKREPFYIRVGGLDRAILGQGNIVYYYNNRASYDNRKIGVELDIDFGKFGFESVYGDLSGKGLLGLRGYTRPLQFTDLKNVPIIGKLEIGGTFATDLNDYSGVTNATIDPNTKSLKILSDEGNISIVGLDALLPIFKSNIVNIDLYSNFTKILKFGSGATLGAGFSFNGLGIVSVDLKFERWFNGDQFIPRYFNQLYEVNRLRVDSSIGLVGSRARELKSARSLGNSYYGELLIDLLNFVQIFGSYSRYDKISNSGILRLETDLSPKNASYVFRAYYDKVGIQSEKDIFTLDDKSILTAEAGYKPISYLLVSFIYQWTFAPVYDVNDKVISYKSQKRIEPRVSLVFPLAFGGKK